MEKNKITNKFLSGEKTKQEAKSELASWALPSSRGAYGFLKKDTWNILKYCHLEMKESIKDIRRSLDIPLINSKTSGWPENVGIEEINKFTPWAFYIFEDNEIPYLFQEPTISNTAYYVIYNRIRRHLFNPLTPSYFQKKLKNTRL
jgi:hypothetical protein